MLQKLLSKGLGVETSIFMSPKNKELEYKGILRFSRQEEKISKKNWLGQKVVYTKEKCLIYHKVVSQKEPKIPYQKGLKQQLKRKDGCRAT